MKRLHVHIAVDNLEENIRFYSALFQTEPSVRKTDYAKWKIRPFNLTPRRLVANPPNKEGTHP
jgi:catechol 2,3-dioxygenase-like lactoylglutathione lyase family enzyme